MTRPPCVALITGGGTAGHTNPGIAIAEALVRRGIEPSAVHFVGGRRGDEGRLVGDAGFSIDLLPGRGIQRKLTPANLRSGAELVAGLLRAVRIVGRRRPAVVVCLGGYAAAGATAAAVLRRTPVVVSEQNARASAVNRLFGRWASACALPFPDTDLPHGRLTGNPVRRSVVDAVQAMDRDRARDELDLPADRVVVAAWAGSLGATRLNEAVADLARRWSERGDVTLYHVVGRRDWERFGHGPPATAADGLDYRLVAYEDRMDRLLVAADLAVCRSGASTVAELGIAGLPAVLVPLPGAPRDHQFHNATELVDAGGALRLADAELDGARLDEVLGPLVADPARRAAMAEAARRAGRPDAADRVADLVLELAGEGGRGRRP
jgi:UDP-N-acetylglucosamine--N-acetylmuramyl-(pentapeptide) pyrophosphoryl-undecaprenol N-acetylglucosamine transferase